MNTKYWVAFSSIEQLDSTFIRKLYGYFGDIERAYNVSEKEIEQIEGLSINKAEEFLAARKRINPDKVFEEVEKRGLKKEVAIIERGCMGTCAVGPVVYILPDETYYTEMTPEKVKEVVEKHLSKASP